MQVCNLGTQEEEVGGLEVHGHPRTHSEFKTRAGCETLSQKCKIQSGVVVNTFYRRIREEDAG